MSVRPVLVVGAAGRVGGAVVASLRSREVPVRALVRDPAALRARRVGVEVARLDLRDPSTFAGAVAGGGALFVVRPPAIARVGPTVNAFVDAAVAAGVDHAVLASVAGADGNRLVPHHRIETHLRATGVAHTLLRPGFFAQNLLGPYREDIRRDDRLYVPAGRGQVAFVDVRDIGEVAAQVLVEPSGHVGAAYELTGPQAVTFDEVAALLSDALGRPIRYEPASALGYARHLRRDGLPLAQTLVQTVLHVGLRRGDAAAVDPTLGRLLGHQPRTVADVIADHTHLWRPER
ncbi:SDR family oxidoreductase [uncultured Serinicoccus sp.]|uniref:SDR family oxidoreductase n=1 Tax=uncultured Serinicoccus sp. TaxID=735514 RepID=UPI00260DA54F|nr:SDR family oxidoreductase [uncultured Serinicoccus sp.]